MTAQAKRYCRENAKPTAGHWRSQIFLLEALLGLGTGLTLG